LDGGVAPSAGDRTGLIPGDLVEPAIGSAAALLTSAQGRLHRGERRRAARLAALIADDGGTEFLLALTDRVMRVTDAATAARVFAGVAAQPPRLGAADRLALRAGALVAPRLPRLVMPLVRARIRRETGALVLPAHAGSARAMARLHDEGFRLNVNVLGELVLGDDEAERRTAAVIAQLRRPDVDYVSVKISALCAQLNVLAFDASVARIRERLAIVLAEAARHRPAKFVNLDMEEYRDLDLTIAAFQQVLDEPRFAALEAGIVLQAYLPDSFGSLQRLCRWAHGRAAGGGAGIKVRVVKGANLAMERVDAELHGWAQAPYTSKAEVDANYKRMVEHLLQPALAGAVRVGVASHNLLDVAWALEVAAALGATDRLEIEMLNGMAPGQARAVAAITGRVLLYTPIVDDADYPSAISYLARRLDENSTPENFLRHALTIHAGNSHWVAEVQRFRAAVAARHRVSTAPRRTQDRSNDVVRFPVDEPFDNVADTDFTRPANRAWIERHLAAGGRPAPPDRLDAAAVDRAVAAARGALDAWAGRGPHGRREVLHRAAEVMAGERGSTIAVMATEAGKTVVEGDVEVSEAIDFARYYAASAMDLGGLPGGHLDPRGVVLVVPPWNFPYAIPAGGVLAALAAGNTVLLKPAPQTERTAWALAEHLWAGGVPADVLQVVPVDEDGAGRHLVTHPGIDAVVLTGSYATARLFLDWRPDLHLVAETSGKNAIVVTPQADVDLAVADIVRSAFGHAGQKCSACSLVIATGGLAEDPAFLRKLADATRSLAVGPATDVRSVVGPLIGPPSGPLERALTALDPGERWLVEPAAVAGTPNLWRPGIRVGVQPGSWFHHTECFGPVLGVIAADDLDAAIDVQNAVAFGLTGGLHSLAPEEVARWLARVEIGNAYVNRHITGAVVRRQPFGGWKRSAVGPTAKAGGPDYVAALGHWRDDPTPPAPADVAAAYRVWWSGRQGHGDDPSALRAERNELRYRPLPRFVVIRADGSTPPDALARALTAAATVGTPIQVSLAAGTGDRAARGLRVPVTIESDAALGARLGTAARLRLLTAATDDLRRAAHGADVPIDEAPVSAVPGIELPRWLRAQAVSETMHRYGNVRRRGDVLRATSGWRGR
jgi:RHH-type proline utilization regulon transcriptional repressor/proline dehydrogenase/delta 1-pyrroline-5-carboxylate dehydrogenase